MKRILVLGSGGAGKSSLARRMGRILDLPVLHLDLCYWNPGWVSTSDEQMRIRVADAIAGDRWVIDGNYSKTLEMRLRAADTVVFLDMPRMLCLWRIVRRWWEYRDGGRPDLPEGCPEQVDFEFLEWVWSYPHESRPQVLRTLRCYGSGKRIVVLRSPPEVERFVEELKQRCE